MVTNWSLGSDGKSSACGLLAVKAEQVFNSSVHLGFSHFKLGITVDICKQVSKLTISQVGLLFLKEILIGLEEKTVLKSVKKKTKPKNCELLEEPTLMEASEETAALGRVTSGRLLDAKTKGGK